MIDKKLRNEINAYMLSVKKHIVCDSKTKKMFIDDFKNDVIDYIETENIMNMDSVYSHFGTAEDVVDEFLKTLSSDSIKKASNWKKIVLITAIVVVAICLIFWLSVVIDLNHGHYVENPVEIISNNI